MRILFTFIILFSAADYVYARYLGVFFLQCLPYCSGRQLRVGARGVCSNMCYSLRSNTKPSLITVNYHRGEDRGCSAYSVPGHRGVSPCGIYSNLRYKRRASDNTCDEYPPATSNESGGNTNPRRPANLRCVPRRENSSGGQQLSEFRIRINARNGDTYRQGYYLPPAGQTIPFCDPASSTNDGTEFKYLGPNRWVDARRSLASDSGFSDVEDIATRENKTTIPQLVYRTSGNHTVVLFHDAEIGEPVWDDAHGSQTIVEKVHDDFSVYWKEQNLGFKPEGAAVAPLQC